MSTKSFLCLVYLMIILPSIACIDEVLLQRLKHIKPRASDEDQGQAVVSLIERLIPKHSSSFVVTVSKDVFDLQDGMDAFEVSSLSDGRIHIKGTTGVAAASGLYYYLKYWCGCSVSWSGDQLRLPDVLPKVNEPVRQEFQERFRYYQNVCTVSYSMAFWNWSRWEREIDWMALNGINLPLAFTGQEAIWQIVYKKLGLTQEELDTHFAGPAFLAWQRMGNIDMWGGPLPDSWYNQQLNLQHEILKRMRSLGMIAVLPGFAGHVPKPLMTRLYPNVTYYKLEGWNGFTGEYGTFLLDVQEPLFQEIGNMFIETQQMVYNGTDHVYNADVFNEMQPPLLTTTFMTVSSQRVYQAMVTKDPQAVWLMQAWLFRADYWTQPLIHAWISANPYGSFVLLDLGSEWAKVYNVTEGFYGYPFIWTMIQNFGGTTRLYGQLELVSSDVQYSRKVYRGNMLGLGSTPEGIEQNDVDFELMYEMAWRTNVIDVTEWGKMYAYRRYGAIDAFVEDAWNFLSTKLYNLQGSLINGIDDPNRPDVMLPRVDKGFSAKIWYNPEDLRGAWMTLFRSAETFKTSSTFRYDITHLGAQVLEDLSTVIYKKMIAAYLDGSRDDFIIYSQFLVGMIGDMDLILATEPHSLLGTWIESAKRLGMNDTERKLLEFNARMQITLWGPHAYLDYASKQWAGLMSDYYQPRWILFNRVILDCMEHKKPFNQDLFDGMVRNVSLAWVKSNNVYTEHPVGNWMDETRRLIEKYGDFQFS